MNNNIKDIVLTEDEYDVFFNTDKGQVESLKIITEAKSNFSAVAKESNMIIRQRKINTSALIGFKKIINDRLSRSND